MVSTHPERLVFGKDERGEYATVWSDDAVSPVERVAFESFSKSISWRPLKLEDSKYVATAALPCSGRIIICRIMEDDRSKDPDKRPLLVRVEGIIFNTDDIRWCAWLNPSAWPHEQLQPQIPLSGDATPDVEVPSITWNPASGEIHLEKPRTELLAYMPSRSEPITKTVTIPPVVSVPIGTKKAPDKSKSSTMNFTRNAFFPVVCIVFGGALGWFIRGQDVTDSQNQAETTANENHRLKNDITDKNDQIAYLEQANKKAQTELNSTDGIAERVAKKTAELIQKELHDTLNKFQAFPKQKPSLSGNGPQTQNGEQPSQEAQRTKPSAEQKP